jgi:6-phosphogluconolactonase
MSRPEIIVKKDVGELSSYAAQLFISIASETIGSRGSFSVSLAGGSTPRRLYSHLAEHHRSSLDWSKVSFFFGDERNVSPESRDSNFRMANETLLLPLEIQPSQIFRWRPEVGDPIAAAEEYDRTLRGHNDRHGRGIDLMLLGLGTDGHTASLFPHTAALTRRDRLAAENWVPHINDYRLTVTFPLINDSANVIFLIAGSEKAHVVAEVLEGEFRPDDLPAQFVVPVSGSLRWLLDRDASSRLAPR